jgi:hypothetical protein
LNEEIREAGLEQGEPKFVVKGRCGKIVNAVPAADNEPVSISGKRSANCFRAPLDVLRNARY